MGIEQTHEQFAIDHAHEFALQRANWLDCFAGLEKAVLTNLLKNQALDGSNKPFAHRLDDLAALVPSPERSKAVVASHKSLAADCKMLLPIRAAIVHSVMQIGRRDGEPVALFHNVSDVARQNPLCVVMTHADFETLLQRLSNLTKRALDALEPPPK